MTRSLAALSGPLGRILLAVGLAAAAVPALRRGRPAGPRRPARRRRGRRLPRHRGTGRGLGRGAAQLHDHQRRQPVGGGRRPRRDRLRRRPVPARRRHQRPRRPPRRPHPGAVRRPGAGHRQGAGAGCGRNRAHRHAEYPGHAHASRAVPDRGRAGSLAHGCRRAPGRGAGPTGGGRAAGAARADRRRHRSGGGLRRRAHGLLGRRLRHVERRARSPLRAQPQHDATCRGRWWATPTSTSSATGRPFPSTARCGSRRRSPWAGPRIASAAGHGSAAGAGPGSTTHRGATRPSTTGGGAISAGAGAGSPGGFVARPVWSPAMVAWYGGGGWSFSVSFGAPVFGWVPLGWGEPYMPWWRGCSDRCWTMYNRPYAVNYAERPHAPPTHYRNWSAPGGVTAVAGATFTGRQPVHRNLVDVKPQLVSGAPMLAQAPGVAKPTAATIPGAKPTTTAVPPPASQFYRTKPMQAAPGGVAPCRRGRRGDRERHGVAQPAPRRRSPSPARQPV